MIALIPQIIFFSEKYLGQAISCITNIYSLVTKFLFAEGKQFAFNYIHLCHLCHSCN